LLFSGLLLLFAVLSVQAVLELLFEVLVAPELWLVLVLVEVLIDLEL